MLRRFVMAALAAGGATANPAAAAPVTVPADAVVEIDNAILLENTRSLEFGTIAAGAGGGTVTIDPATDAASSVGSVSLYGPLRHRAEFVSRAPIGTVMVTLLDSSATLTHSGGVATMTATLSRANGPGLATATVFGLPIGIQATAADQYIYVGGALTVAPGQLEGVYSGQFDLSVNHL